MGLKKQEEKEYARLLYVNERTTLEDIATRVGITSKTLRKWRDEEGWDKLRQSLLTTRQSQLVHWYNHLDSINEAIAKRDGIPTTTEADTMSKTTSNIQKLEFETSIGEYIEVGRKVLTFVQDINLEDAKLLKKYFDEFINVKLKQH